MKKIILSLLLSLGVACSSKTLPTTIPAVESIAQNSSVALVQNHRVVCGAVAISPHHLVTANHCIKDNTIEFFDEESNGIGTKVGMNTVDDLAL